MKNKNTLGTCDVCKKSMLLTESRIEWIYPPNTTQTIKSVQICHHDCSHGANNSKIPLADIIFEKGSDFSHAYDKLPELQTTYPDYADEFTRIFSMIFD